MPNKPFDPEDTGWGQKVNKRVDNLEYSFSLVKSQIAELDLHVADVRKDNLSIRDELRKNTDITNATNDSAQAAKKAALETKSDTAWLVDALRGARAWGPVVLWIVLCLGGVFSVVGVYFAITHK